MNGGDLNYYFGKSGGGVFDDIKNKITTFVNTYPIAIFVVLVVLIIWVVAMWAKKEGFNPTSTLRYQVRDGLGEHLAAGPADSCGKSISSEDAWQWAYDVAKGPGEDFKPATDSDFSRILTGQ